MNKVIYERNMSLLEKKDALLSRIVAGADTRGIEVLYGQSGCISAKVATKHGDKILLNSLYDPFREAENCVASADLPGCNIVIVLGFGMGYHVKVILKKYSANYIVVIEPDPAALKTAIENVDMTDALENRNVLFCAGDSAPEEIFSKVESIFGMINLPRLRIVKHIPSMRANPEYFRNILASISSLVNMGEKNFTTLKKFSYLWNRNILLNLNEAVLNPGVAELFGKFKDVPAIIVSAGPSLDGNVRDLKQAKGRCVIISVDTSLKTLLKERVIPDFVVSVDAQEGNFSHFAGVACREFSLVADTVVNPKILKCCKGGKFISSYGNPLMSWIEKFMGNKGFLLAGGSVATSCFQLASNMGCAPIILVGQDLAFSNNITHTKGSAHYERTVLKANKFSGIENVQKKTLTHMGGIRTRGNVENYVTTNSMMMSWKRWFELQIKGRDILCVNATEGGAKIDGATQMKLTDAISEYCMKEVNLNDALDGALKNYNPRSIMGLMHELKELRNKTNVILERSGDVLKAIDGASGDDAKKKLAGVIGDVRMVISFRDFFEIGRWIFEPYLLRIEDVESRSVPGDDFIKLYVEFFREITYYAKEMRTLLDKAIENLKGLVLKN